MLSFRPAVWSFPHSLHCWATAAEEAVLGRLPSLHTPCPLCCPFPCCPSRCLIKHISSAVAFLGDPLASFSVKKGKEAEREEGAAGDGEWQPTVGAQSEGPRWRWTAGTSAPSLKAAALRLGCCRERRPWGTEPGSAAAPSLAPASSVTLGKST